MALSHRGQWFDRAQSSLTGFLARNRLNKSAAISAAMASRHYHCAIGSPGASRMAAYPVRNIF
jgi:hypothetical protein